MSQIKTITATLIRKILNDDFHPGQLVAESADRKQIEAIDTTDIDTLIFRLEQVKDLVEDQKNSKEHKAKALLESLVGKDSDFASVADLLAAVSGESFAKATTKSKPKTANSSNKAFTVRWSVSGKDNKKEEVSYVIQNNQPQGAILNDSFYQNAIKKLNGDVHEFQMTYSPEYAEAYKAKCNAKFDGNAFYINERGALNSKASEFFVQWLDTQAEDVQNLDDKKQKQLFKSAVMN